jgi:glycine cleavage system H protein
MEVDGCPLPEDRLYDLENEVWLKAGPGPTDATLGFVSSLVAFAGRFQSVSYRAVEGVVLRGRSIATVESMRFTGAVRVPVDATVLERNAAIVARPKLVNDDPYGAGWLARLTLGAPLSPSDHLRSASEVRERFAERIRELRIRCYPASPDVELYEIGAECSAILARLDEEVARRADGEVILLVTDDPTSPIEMVRWSDRTGHSVLAHRREDRLEHFLVRREAEPKPRRRS